MEVSITTQQILIFVVVTLVSFIAGRISVHLKKEENEQKRAQEPSPEELAELKAVKDKYDAELKKLEEEEEMLRREAEEIKRQL